jgi:hypothetical protein
MAPWQSVLLKHPGGVPGAAGVSGASDELSPPAWHGAQTGALPVSVPAWLLVALLHGFGEWGAATAAPWQPALFRQDRRAVPPRKSLPWQVWQ